MPNVEQIKKELLKAARDAFEQASTLYPSERLEVYLDAMEVKTSRVLEENEQILYIGEKVLCYSVYGYDDLEEEIKTWIDYARTIPSLNDELPPPSDLEIAVRELIDELAKKRAMPKESISSYEVFANMPMNLLGTIEQQIIEYWWGAKGEENAKSLALEQIEAGLKKLS
ncbi:MAG: hypothetical protein AB7D43_02820 [Sulfurimonadaceae bacterium]